MRSLGGSGIRLTRLRAQVEAPQGWTLPPFVGATIRGGFGATLRRVCCAARTKSCGECLLRPRCLYPKVFEPTLPEGALKYRSLSAIPRPFVIEPPAAAALSPGQSAEVGLVLIGHAIEALPYFVHTLVELGKRGLGRTRATYTVRSVHGWASGNWVLTYDAVRGLLRDAPVMDWAEIERLAQPHRGTTQIALELVTPVRLKFGGRLASRPDFHILIRNILRRVAQLAFFYCGGKFEADFRGIIERAHAVEIAQCQVEWRDLRRFSTRQQVPMLLGGMVGRVTYRGPLDEFLELLVLGELLHVGKGTTFGLGQYRILQREG